MATTTLKAIDAAPGQLWLHPRSMSYYYIEDVEKTSQTMYHVTYASYHDGDARWGRGYDTHCAGGDTVLFDVEPVSEWPKTLPHVDAQVEKACGTRMVWSNGHLTLMTKDMKQWADDERFSYYDYCKET